VKRKRYVLLDPELDASVAKLCEQTRRDLPYTLRAIIEMFMADGIDAANARLSSGLWVNQPGLRRLPLDETKGWTEAELARYIADGTRPTEARKKKRRST
jgi:hypothetical protein